MSRLVAAIVLLGLVGWLFAQQRSSLVVHEWGTFTSLQDENGKAMSGIVEDVEPLPPFVVNLFPASGPKGLPDSFGQSVTMRLETPVVYFHLPSGAKPMTFTFSAKFNGGVINQYFPNAQPQVQGETLLGVKEQTVGAMTWNNLTVGRPAAGPETTSPVWLAPREVNAADVSANGQAERYIFYRGVGRLNAPLKVVRSENSLLVAGQPDPVVPPDTTLKLPPFWYLDVQPDGTTAFRTIDGIPNIQSSASETRVLPADFSPADYSPTRLAALKAEMKVALVSAGLFEDEAAAMLKTWDQAYFKSPGSRVLFIVPRAWTDARLPISVSAPAQIERVMVGRIDLITPAQRQLARRYLSLRGEQPEKGANLLALMGRFAGTIVHEESMRQAAPGGRISFAR